MYDVNNGKLSLRYMGIVSSSQFFYKSKTALKNSLFKILKGRKKEKWCNKYILGWLEQWCL